MLTIAVCDDSKAFADMLLQKIRRLCAYSLPDRIVCQTAPAFNSASDLLAYLNVRSVDILFLDIDMPETSGFELAEILQRQHPETLIIFVSAYDQFVYSCFEYSPFRFLRKTKLEEELPSALQKAIEKIAVYNETMSFNSTDGEITLPLRSIVYFEGAKNYYVIHCTSGETFRCRGTVTAVEEMTSKLDFFRIHSAYVINMNHVDLITDLGRVRLKGGATLDISRRNLTTFKRAYLQFTRRRLAQ